ncbi:MAG: acetylornithine deacetylase [Pararhodobacter sp.]|nr:acetylornithine deacetylase [Pararhodobacter sp.]
MSQTIAHLARLVSFQTPSACSNLELIAFVQDFLTARGFTVTRVPDPSGQKAGLFATLGPPGAGLLLSAHTDVVPAEGQAWTRPPFTLTSDSARLYGRGTTDMKGFLAAMMSAADKAARLPLKEPLKLAISYDEEIGCVGIRQMLSALPAAIGTPRGCIVGEPTGMMVATGHKGKAALRAVCHGQGGHSALAPRFVNALHLAAEFVQELRALQGWLAVQGARDPAYDIPFSTVHVGMLSGGRALNIVPDHAELTFEFRHLAADDPAELTRRIEAAAEAVSARYRDQFAGAQVQIMQENAYPGLDTPPDAPIVQEVMALAGHAQKTKVAFGTEAGYFHALGIPTVVCGPGDMAGQGHKPDEFITRDQLEACDAMMDSLLVSLC